MSCRMKRLSYLLLSFAWTAMVACSAQAQSGYTSTQLRSYQNQNSASNYSADTIRQRLLSRSVTNAGVSGVNRRSYLSSTGPSRKTKPFSSLKRGPTVSPYLSLSGSLNGVSDYYNVVRPQQQRRRENELQQRQYLINEKRLNQIAAQGPYSIQGDQELAPTGHAAVHQYTEGSFQNTGNFFPPLVGLEKR